MGNITIRAYPLTIGLLDFRVCCSVDDDGIVDVLCGLSPEGKVWTVEDLIVDLQLEHPVADSIDCFEVILNACEVGYQAMEECTLDGALQDQRNKYSEELASGWNGYLV